MIYGTEKIFQEKLPLPACCLAFGIQRSIDVRLGTLCFLLCHSDGRVVNFFFGHSTYMTHSFILYPPGADITVSCERIE